MREFFYIFCLIGAFAPYAVWADFLPNRVVPFPTVPVPPTAYRADGTAGFLTPAPFPKTAADLNPEDRMALKIESYKPFSNLKSYNNLIVEGEVKRVRRSAHALDVATPRLAGPFAHGSFLGDTHFPIARHLPVANIRRRRYRQQGGNKRDFHEFLTFL